eukprot:ANDGO_07737.mRNA.1 hypothetical protein
MVGFIQAALDAMVPVHHVRPSYAPMSMSILGDDHDDADDSGFSLRGSTVTTNAMMMMMNSTSTSASCSPTTPGGGPTAGGPSSSSSSSSLSSSSSFSFSFDGSFPLLSKQRAFRLFESRRLSKMPTTALSHLILFSSLLSFLVMAVAAPRFGYFELPASRFACLLCACFELLCAVLEDAWYASPLRKYVHFFVIQHTAAVGLSAIALCSAMSMGKVFELVWFPVLSLLIHAIAPTNQHYAFSLIHFFSALAGPANWKHEWFFSLGVPLHECIVRAVYVPYVCISLVLYPILFKRVPVAYYKVPALLGLYLLSFVSVGLVSVIAMDDHPRLFVQSLVAGTVMLYSQLRLRIASLNDPGIWLYVVLLANEFVLFADASSLLWATAVFQTLRLAVLVLSIAVPPPKQLRTLPQ